MRTARTLAVLSILAMAMPWLTTRSSAGGSSISADELVAKHLESIGPAAVRAGIKTRVVQGEAKYTVPVGGQGELLGKMGFVAQGNESRLMMKFSANNYHGENFAYDGKTVFVSFSHSQQARSPFAGFVGSQDAFLKEGLFGGALGTGWALFDTADRKPKLTSEGLKKIDGRELYQLRYLPKKSSDLEIFLYFDPENFHHVLTTYLLKLQNSVTQDVLASAKFFDERTEVRENFDDFQAVDGLTLPTKWTIHFTRELRDGSTTVSMWEMKATDIHHNVGLDASNFELK